MNVTNRTEIRLVGMSRSGNHPLIHWILSQAHGAFCFLNCCEGKSNPFETARVLDDGRLFMTNIDGFDLEAERAGHFTSKDLLLFNHEDNFLANAFSALFERHHDQWVGLSERRFDVLLLRDPFNLFASRMSLSSTRVTPATEARIWKQHASQFIDGARRLRHNPVLVRYDQWVTQPAYRRELAERLGLVFTDRGVDHVPPCGGGSSFDGRRFDGAADRMPVLQRWRQVLSDPAYRARFDDEIIDMAEAIFGAHPAADALRQRSRCSPRGHNARAG